MHHKGWRGSSLLQCRWHWQLLNPARHAVMRTQIIGRLWQTDHQCTINTKLSSPSCQESNNHKAT